MSNSDLIIPTDASSFQAGLLPSSLTVTSFSSGSENNSSLIGLQKTSSTSSASGLIDTNQETLTNYSNSVSTISDSLPLFNQSVFSTSLTSQLLPKNSTTGLDPLTGSGKNLSLVGINSNDSLLNPSSVLKGKFGNFDNHQNFQLTLQDANGNPESFSLTGDGEGEVFQTDLGEQIIFTGTDGTTKVQISASNNLQFGDYIGSELKVQTKGSITSGNITLKNTALENSPGLSLQSGLSDSESLTDTGYSVTDLTTLLGGYVTAINDSGQIVGQLNSSGHPFLYSNGQMIDLGTFSQSVSMPTAINDSDQIAGGIYTNNDSAYNAFAFLYSDGKTTDLGNYTDVASINSSGQVVGVSNSDTSHYYTSHGFLYSDGHMTDLGTLPRGSYSSATAINDSGQIVGYSQTADFIDVIDQMTGRAYSSEPGFVESSDYFNQEDHAFLYSNGHMTDLGTLPRDKFSEATDINNSGQIVGLSGQGRNYLSHAFLYSGGHMIDLGTLPGDNYSWATAINDSGTVVGYSSSSSYNNSPFQPFLYTNGKMTDLNSLIPQDSGWTLSDARAINNKGQILGDGYIGGQYHQFLLNPISTRATPKDGITVGNISTQGSSVLLQGLKINLTGSKVVTKGGNITFDGPTILNSSTGAYTFNSAKSTATSKGGDITFKNTLDSNSAGASSLSLTGGLGNITFNNAVGGNASLKDLTVNSAKTFTALGDITSQGNIAISANQNITTNSLTSNNGAVKVNSQQGTVATIDITSGSSTTVTASQNLSTGTVLANSGAVKLISNLGSVSTKDITSGSSTTVTASQNLSTGTVLANSGAVSLTSKFGAVTTKDITTSGNADDITLKAASDISTANLSANGSGKVSIFLDKDTNSENQPSGDITTGSITAKQLEILSSGAVTTSGDITTSGGIIIAAVGDINTRNIRAQNGVVGLFSSLGAVTTQGNIITSSYTIGVEADEEKSNNKEKNTSSVANTQANKVGINLKALIQIYRPIGELVAGAIYQYGANNVAGINQILELAFPEIKQINLKGEAAADYLGDKYKWFRSGRMIGDGITLYTALQEIEIGGAIGGGGAAALPETGGASVGLVVAGGAILLHGSHATSQALADLFKQVFHSSTGEGTSGSTPTPSPGVGGNGTTSDFGSLNGWTRKQVDDFLINRGATKSSSSSGQYETYKFPDNSKVDVRASDGRITRSPAPKYDSTGRNINKGKRLNESGQLLDTRNPDGSQIPGTHDSTEFISDQ